MYLPEEDLEALKEVTKRDLLGEGVRRVWLPTAPSDGPVALWDGMPARTSLEHDTLYDEK